MKFRSIIILASISATACAPRMYNKPGMTQAGFNMDAAQCQMQSQYLPQQYTPPPPTTYSAQTTVIGNTAYTSIRQNPNPGAGFAALGDVLSNIAAQEAFLHNCMISKGYSEVARNAQNTSSPYSSGGATGVGTQTVIIAKQIPPPDSAFKEVSVRAKKLRYDVELKSAATFDSDTVTSLKSGSIVSISKTNGVWSYAETASKQKGYVADSWISDE